MPTPSGVTDVEALAGSPGGWVVSVASGVTTRRAWASLQRRIGGDFAVLPVLDDGEGGMRFPTGRISVRFAGARTERELRQFATDVGLVLHHRTKFVEHQAVFEPADPGGEYLPDVVERLTRLPEVESAWLDAQSRYQRSG